LALTGQRRDEIGSLRWSEINFDKAVISLPPERTKNSRPHDVPLSDAALTILEKLHATAGYRDFVFGIRGNGFQGWSKSKETLDASIALPDWRLHDLRRTVSTRMHDELGIAPHVVDVAGVYNRDAKEKAVALARWAEHLGAIVGGESSKIVPIKGGARR
jgi:integrase